MQYARVRKLYVKQFKFVENIFVSYYFRTLLHFSELLENRLCLCVFCCYN